MMADIHFCHAGPVEACHGRDEPVHLSMKLQGARFFSPHHF